MADRLSTSDDCNNSEVNSDEDIESSNEDIESDNKEVMNNYHYVVRKTIKQ